MEEDVVGLDVCEGAVAAARVRLEADGSLVLRNAAWVDLPAGAAEADVESAVRRVWRQAGMPSYTVCASFRRRSVVTKPFHFPALSHDEFESAVRLEAEQSLQLPPEEIRLDWYEAAPTTPAMVTASARPREGLLAAAPAAEVDEFVALLRRAGLYPVALDLGVTALYNAYQALAPGAQKAGDYALLHLSAQSAEMVVVSEGAAPYARTVYARSADWESSLRYLVESVQDALKYCEFKLRWRRAPRLYATGAYAGLAPLTARLEAEIGIPVERWNPLDRVKPGSGRQRYREPDLKYTAASFSAGEEA